MELALISFNQIVTMIIIMLIGLLCAKIKLIDEETNKKLSAFLLLLVNPLVIFVSYQRTFEMALLKGLFISIGLAVLTFAVNLLVTHTLYFKKNGKIEAIEKYACVYSNSGFIGIPLIQGVFGSEGVFYLTAFLTVSNLLMWTHGVAVMSGTKDRSLIKKAVLAPAFLATVIGFITFLLRIEMPRVIMNPIEILGGTNTALAMIIAGVTISKANIGKIIKKAQVYKICLIRLLVIPFIMIGIFSFFNYSETIIGTIIIAAACPIAANIILFAYRYEKDSLYASELFVASTILSLATIPLLMLFI